MAERASDGSGPAAAPCQQRSAAAAC